ncbi:MAG: hypothetical protein KME64_20845 [Scytonematopsis contorta HA4267-MV1]|jgi:hypothetical protein|nr:hypothetical protein [Scytonematopsis contorta HA4267-MV1]
MSNNQKPYTGEIQINDLIDSAVKNAVERRNPAIDLEDNLPDLSDKQAESILGGTGTTITKLELCKPKTKPICPIIVGLIAPSHATA